MSGSPASRMRRCACSTCTRCATASASAPRCRRRRRPRADRRRAAGRRRRGSRRTGAAGPARARSARPWPVSSTSQKVGLVERQDVAGRHVGVSEQADRPPRGLERPRRVPRREQYSSSSFGMPWEISTTSSTIDRALRQAGEPLAVLRGQRLGGPRRRLERRRVEATRGLSRPAITLSWLPGSSPPGRAPDASR